MSFSEKLEDLSAKLGSSFTLALSRDDEIVQRAVAVCAHEPGSHKACLGHLIVLGSTW